VEVVTDGVVDEALLLLRHVACLVAEHNVVIPPAFARARVLVITSQQHILQSGFLLCASLHAQIASGI
jgi:hypothetical protein